MSIGAIIWIIPHLFIAGISTVSVVLSPGGMRQGYAYVLLLVIGVVALSAFIVAVGEARGLTPFLLVWSISLLAVQIFCNSIIWRNSNRKR